MFVVHENERVFCEDVIIFCGVSLLIITAPSFNVYIEREKFSEDFDLRKGEA